MSNEDELAGKNLRALLEALVTNDVEPPADLRARVLMRIARSVGGGKPPVTVVRAAEGEWRECLPGVHVKSLRDDGITHTWLARLEKGGRVPPHDHDMDEECWVIEGILVLDGIELHPGDYQVARAGSRHDDAFSPTGCLALLRTQSPAPRMASV